MKDPGEFMGGTVRRLAQARPDLCDRSGRGFVVANYNFPLLLTHALHALQGRITQEYASGNRRMADALAAQRIGFMHVVYEGDLGENHNSLFIDDHPELSHLTGKEYATLPYQGFCRGLLQETDEISLMGALTRNEEGSIGEVIALVEAGMIRKGPFSETHMEEEVEHARISRGIRAFFMGEPRFRRAFEEGMRMHDRLYAQVPSEAAAYTP